MADTSPTSSAWRSSDDLASIQALASRRLARDWPAVRIHPGDLDWWAVQAWGRGPEQPALAERARLWPGDPTAPADTDLLAFAWYVPPGDLDVVFDPRLADGAEAGEHAAATIRQALTWGESQRDRWAGDRSAPVLAWAAEGSAEAALMEAVGREPVTHGRGYLQLTAALEDLDLAMPAPPDGLVVRSLTDVDVESRVVCGRAAFPGSTMTPERYRRTFHARLYRPELDGIITDPMGRVVAFALGWYDDATGCVELEPVGVHPERHRTGLGRLICRSVLAAARDLGATRAMISAERENPAAVGLYRSLGLEVTTTIVPFLPAAPTGRASEPSPG